MKKIPYFDEEDDIVRYRLDEPEERDPVYTAMGAFITAYAREKTIRSAQAVFPRFVYADTDSLSLVGYDVPEDLDVHPTALGAWKNEGLWEDSLFVRPKTYMKTLQEVEEDTLRNYAKLLSSDQTVSLFREPDGIHASVIKVTCAGMPENVKRDVTYDNFHSGSVFEGKLVPKQYPGGVVLESRTFTIR